VDDQLTENEAETVLISTGATAKYLKAYQVSKRGGALLKKGGGEGGFFFFWWKKSNFFSPGLAQFCDGFFYKGQDVAMWGW